MVKVYHLYYCNRYRLWWPHQENNKHPAGGRYRPVHVMELQEQLDEDNADDAGLYISLFHIIRI